MKQTMTMLFAGLLMSAQVAWADPIWIDVRGDSEHASDHIDGDVHIPLAELDAQALAAQYGKDAEFKLYCRSGNRAGQALEILQSAGFTNVSNEGGIAAVRTLRGIATQSPATETADSTTPPAQ